MHALEDEEDADYAAEEDSSSSEESSDDEDNDLPRATLQTLANNVRNSLDKYYWDCATKPACVDFAIKTPVVTEELSTDPATHAALSTERGRSAFLDALCGILRYNVAWLKGAGPAVRVFLK